MWTNQLVHSWKKRWCCELRNKSLRRICKTIVDERSAHMNLNTSELIGWSFTLQIRKRPAAVQDFILAKRSAMFCVAESVTWAESNWVVSTAVKILQSISREESFKKCWIVFLSQMHTRFRFTSRWSLNIDHSFCARILKHIKIHLMNASGYNEFYLVSVIRFNINEFIC